MDDDEQRYALASAIRTAMEEGGITQEELGARLAHVEGRPEPFTQSFMSDLAKGRRSMQPSRVFAIERALKLPAGTLSRIAGYLPADAVPTATVGEAIERASELTPEQREDLRQVYQGMAERTEARRAKRRQPAGQ